MTMSIAYVLINTEIGGMEEVLRTLEKIPEVKEAHMFYGVYDIIAKIRAKTNEDLRDLVVKKIHLIPNIINSKLITVLKTCKEELVKFPC